MKSPENVLNNLVKHSNVSGYKFERLYRILFNEQMFFVAYQRIYAKQGNMTAGTDGKTIDEMSLQRIESLITSLKNETYRPNPAKRVYIPKKDGKKRPLGIPSFEDKLVQEVVRMILEAIYEKFFEPTSHGFRPRKSCHTALTHVQKTFLGTKWFIEGDIKGFFDNINHNVLIGILRERIDDERFLRLIRKFLNAGYIENWKYNNTYSGTPQGGVISPILANIYLDKFDKYIEKYIQTFNKGEGRQLNKEYRLTKDRKRRLVQKLKTETDANVRKDLIRKIKAHSEQMLNMPSSVEMDEGYRRFKYVRYADDFLIGIVGTKAECEVIKANITQFMSEKLKLELSAEKTLITHAQEAARFLGYEITIRNSNATKRDKNGNLKRMFNQKVVLLLPRDVVKKKLLAYDAAKIIQTNGKEDWKPKARRCMVNCKPQDILAQTNTEIRGFYNYYSIANNVSTICKRFSYIMEYSMYRTLAQKLNISVSKIIKRFSKGKDFIISYTDTKGKSKCRVFYNEGFQKKEPKCHANCDNVPNTNILPFPSLIERLKAEQCEVCGTHSKTVMHHVRTLKTLTGKNEWEQVMLKMHRKTLAVCPVCNAKIHNYEH
ncbi:MAG: group II intron reverse transcriptase/maturase [Clostridium sp.]|nr:group II intron reverse transcriptase/maturase [Clostridium sp.]